jgi:hypothetical protein
LHYVKRILTEDRTFAHIWDIRSKIAQALLQCNEQSIISESFDSSAESELDFDWESTPPKEAFRNEVIKRLRLHKKIPESALAAVKKRMSQMELEEHVAPEVPTNFADMFDQEPEAKLTYFDRREADHDAYIKQLQDQVAYWKTCARLLGKS